MYSSRRAIAHPVVLLTGALLATLLIAPAAAQAAKEPIVGTVTSTHTYRLAENGMILTDVTLATSSGSREFTMRGGTLGSLGMLTEEFTELKVADRVVVPAEDSSERVLVVTDAPIVLSGTGGVSASAVTDYVYTGQKWSAMPLAWRLNTTNAPSGALGAIQAAADTWEADAGSDIDFSYGGTTSSVPGTDDGVNSVGWRQNTGGGNLATCVIWYYNTQGSLGYNRIIEFDIDFNRSYSWVNGSVTGSFDIQSVALHELGHSLHLADLHDATPTSVQEVMNGYIGDGELMRVLGSGDLAGARAIYPAAVSDSTPPVLSSDAVSEYTDEARVRISATDAGSGVASVGYRVDSGSWTVVNGSSTTAVITGAGAHTIDYYAVDGFGNRADASRGFTVVDRTVPQLSSNAVSNYYSEARILISASDAGSGIARIGYRVNGSAWTTVTASQTTAVITQLGAHSIDYFAIDNAGNRADATRAFSITTPPPPPPDTTPPYTSAVISPAGWTRGPVTLTLSAADDRSGVASSYYRVASGAQTPYSSPVSLSAEGLTTVSYWSVDTSGNVESPRTSDVRIDRTDPTITSDALKTYIGTASIRLLAADTLSGISRITYRLDGGPSIAVPKTTADVSVTTVGDHRIDYTAEDLTGNVATGSSSFRVESQDRSAPVTRASGIPSAWTSGTVTVSLQADDPGLAATYIRVGSAAPVRYSAPVDVSSEGETPVHYWSVDTAGNVENTNTVFARIDRTPPSVLATVEPTYRDSAVVTLTASDALSGLDRVEWRIDKGGWQTTTTPVAALSVSSPGRHTLSYRAYDAAGNAHDGTASLTVVTATTLSISPSGTKTVTRRRGVTSVTLSGVARYADGSRIPRASVILEKSSNGRDWRYVTRVAATSSGSFAKKLTFRSAATTYWRWRVQSNPTLGHDAGASRSLRIRVR